MGSSKSCWSIFQDFHAEHLALISPLSFLTDSQVFTPSCSRLLDITKLPLWSPHQSPPLGVTNGLAGHWKSTPSSTPSTVIGRDFPCLVLLSLKGTTSKHGKLFQTCFKCVAPNWSQSRWCSRGRYITSWSNLQFIFENCSKQPLQCQTSWAA